nr:hypothetical protein [Pandoravirus massiliensis]
MTGAEKEAPSAHPLLFFGRPHKSRCAMWTKSSHAFAAASVFRNTETFCVMFCVFLATPARVPHAHGVPSPLFFSFNKGRREHAISGICDARSISRSVIVIRRLVFALRHALFVLLLLCAVGSLGLGTWRQCSGH